MNHRIVIAAVALMAVASCKKRAQPEQFTTPVIPTTQVSTSSFRSTTDTFKGFVDKVYPYYVKDTPVFFYVHHFRKDSFHIACNTGFYVNSTQPGITTSPNYYLRINDSGAYHVPTTYDIISFKHDTLFFSWQYADEVYKMPSGGTHVYYVRVYGKKVHNGM